MTVTIAAMGWIQRVERAVVVALVGISIGCGDDTVATGDTDTDAGAATLATGSSDSSGREPTGASENSGSSDEGADSTGDSTSGEPAVVEPDPAGAGLAAGHGFSCSVDDGALTCWGHNACGQLGDGTQESKAPVAVAPENTWAFVATGAGHACAIDDGGALWCWGDGSDGKIGDGVATEFLSPLVCRTEPVEIDPGTTWARVAAGRDHTCGVQTDGTLWCWGSSESGQIGDGALGPLYTRLVPTQVDGDDWIDVNAGDAHSCGLRSNGSVWCWGAGEALDPTGFRFSSTPLALDLPATIRALGRGGSLHVCAIDDADSVWCWGRGALGETGTTRAMTEPNEVSLGGGAAEVATTGSTTCARRNDGAVLCFGLGTSGQLGDGVAEGGHQSALPLEVPLPAAAISVTVGLQHACARTDEGVDLCWGGNRGGEIGDGTSGSDNGRLTPTPAMPWGGGEVAQGFTAISVGDDTTCAVRDGALWCTGSRRFGALGTGDAAGDCSLADPAACIVTTPRAVEAQGPWSSASVGDAHACATAADGTLWCWGANGSGQLGFTGDDALVPAQLGSDDDWIGVSAGGSSTCGIREPGSLWCWGSDSLGQLADGVPGGASAEPIRVGADDDWLRVVVGAGHVCGIRAGGQLWCWGPNDYGQLGQGVTGDPIATPTSIPGEWSTVASSDLHTCAVATDGTLWCWGRNAWSELGNAPSDVEPLPLQVGTDGDWAAVAATDSTSCGLREGGDAWCWGRNFSGTIGNGVVGDGPFADPTMVVDVPDLVAISGGRSTMCGVATDGTAWCWGANGGRQGNDTNFTSGTPTQVRDDD